MYVLTKYGDELALVFSPDEAVRLGDTLLVDNIVAHQASGFQYGAGQPAQLGTGFALGAEHVAGGNGGDMQAVR